MNLSALSYLCWFLLIEGVGQNMLRQTPPLEERFASPPADRRILRIIHNFPNDPRQHEKFLQSLADQGFGGVVCNVHFQDYLRSEELWQSFVQAVQLAKKMGMTLWLYDEEGYPSGVAGGLTLQGHPEWQARGLYIATAHTDGPAVDVELPPGELIYATACPARDGGISFPGAVDLVGFCEAGHLRWSAPAGRWHVFAFVENVAHEGTHAVANLYRAQPYINLLDVRPTQRFLELTHQEYARRLSPIASFFEATFTDEPSLMTGFLRKQPWPALPWADDLEATFKAAKGYDLRPFLPGLVADAGPQGHRARCDFWDHVAQRVADGFFGQIRSWCREAGVASSGHLLFEESLTHHCVYYGDFYRCAEQLDFPGMDCLTSLPPTVPWHVAKLLGSIAHLHGAPKVMSETSDHAQRYRRSGDERPRQVVTTADIVGTCNLLYVAGVNTTTSYYSWTDISPDELRRINEFVGRCGVMLTGGEPITDIAVLYPIESIWPHFLPAQLGATDSVEAQAVDRVYRDVQTQLFAHQRDFEIINAAAVARGEVGDGVLHTGRLSFRAIILPNVDTLPIDAWRRIVQFWDQGGIVLMLGKFPANTTQDQASPELLRQTALMLGADGALPDSLRIHQQAGRTAGFIPHGLEALLPQILDGLLEPDFSAEPTPSPLRYAHRRLEEREVYFVVNNSPQAVEAQGWFSAAGPAELWKPENGEMVPVQAQAQGKGALVPLNLAGYGAVFVVFPRAVERQRITAGQAMLPMIEAEPLAQDLTFTWHGPKHVEATVSDATVEFDGEARFATVVDSIIRTGGVDSWSFVSTAIPAGADLGRYDALRLRTFVPPGQDNCRTSLLVILRETGGAEYIASSGRPLREAGWQRSTLWFDAFSLAGWSKDDNGALDRDKIANISLGWGGYYGEQDERIRFAIGEIELLRLRAARP